MGACLSEDDIILIMYVTVLLSSCHVNFGKKFVFIVDLVNQ
jgi:hypothetical protein